MLNRLEFTTIILFLLVMGCGDGSVAVNTEAGDDSDLPLADILRDDAEENIREYFIENIYPIMALSDNSQGGCAVSGCHLVNDTVRVGDDDEAQFFQVDPDDPELTWQYARYRRTTVEGSEYTDGGSKTIDSQRLKSHNAFAFWTDEQEQFIVEWINLQ